MNRDLRPSVAIGHLKLSTPDVDSTLAFLDALGARVVHRSGSLAIVEVRGGTHLVVREGSADAPGFDLMVDGLPQVHETLAARGFGPAPIESGRIHSSFRVTDQAGVPHTLTSSHAVGPV
ncbi:MAG: VOC family protein [Myxococcota bacterium]